MHLSISSQTGVSKEEQYKALLPQIEELLTYESDLTACLSSVTAALKDTFGFFWVGFYIVKGGELVVGPYQGPMACTRIAFHRGVCGACYTQKQTIIVPDVDAFPGHIACSSASRSEIVVPVFHRNGAVEMVLDVDSDTLATFDTVDAMGLEKIAALLTKKL